MKAKMEWFVHMLYSTKEVLKAHKASFVLVFILLFVNIALISVPNFIGIWRGVDRVDDLEGIHEAFQEMYEARLPCAIETSAQMICDDVENQTFGMYDFVIDPDFKIDEDELEVVIERSSIFVTTEDISIVYVREDGSGVVVSGDYRLLQGFDFSSIKDRDEAQNDRTDYYDSVTNMFLRNVYYSTMQDNMFIVYSAQFVQMLLYVMFVSVIMMVLNYKAKIKKLSYSASVKITVFTMTGPAFLAAVLGFIIVGWASILFTALYLVRIILVYYKINTIQETLY